MKRLVALSIPTMILLASATMSGIASAHEVNAPKASASEGTSISLQGLITETGSAPILGSVTNGIIFAQSGSSRYNVCWDGWIENLRAFLYEPLHKLDKEYPRGCKVDVRFRLSEDGTLLSSNSVLIHRGDKRDAARGLAAPETLPARVDATVREILAKHKACLAFPEPMLRASQPEQLRHDLEWSFEYSNSSMKNCTLTFSDVNLDEFVYLPQANAPLGARAITAPLDLGCMPGEPEGSHKSATHAEPIAPKTTGRVSGYPGLGRGRFIRRQSISADADGF